MSQTNHLIRRNGTWYYRRRVPLALVENIGSKFIQFSLHTTDLNEAKKRRAVEDIKTAHRFEAAGPKSSGAKFSKTPSGTTPEPLSQAELLRLVCNYVERSDDRWQSRLIENPPENRDQQKELRDEVDLELCLIQDRDDPNADQAIYSAGKKILQSANLSIDDPAVSYVEFAEWVRRGLIELQHRKFADFDDQPARTFDRAFSRDRRSDVTFGQLADQAMRIAVDDAAANRISAKWIDKQRANFVLLREIIGDSTPVRDIDYDICLNVRSVLARVPAGRTKLYNGVSLDEAISRARTDDRPGLAVGPPRALAHQRLRQPRLPAHDLSDVRLDCVRALRVCPHRRHDGFGCGRELYVRFLLCGTRRELAEDNTR